MFNSEKKFDSAFDDIFNQPEFHQLFGCPILDPATFQRRFTIAYLLGQTLRIPATVLALMILRGQIKRTGVFPCEVLNAEERKIFFEGIKEWDVIIHKQITSDIA